MRSKRRKQLQPTDLFRIGLVFVAVGVVLFLAARTDKAPLDRGVLGARLMSSPLALWSPGEFSVRPSWEQDFTKLPDGKVDPNYWRYDLNPAVPSWNQERQGYTDSLKNVRIEDGRLVIEAHKEKYVYPTDPKRRSFDYTSGRIDTLTGPHGLTFVYGKVEVVMRVPEGGGTWPAAWLLSADRPYSKEIIKRETTGLSGGVKAAKEEALWQSPRFPAHDGELDIMEFYGNEPQFVEGTAHVFKRSSDGRTPVKDATKKFHTYGMEVTPTEVRWTIDGRLYHRFEKTSDNPEEWPFTKDNRLFLILNLALGGSGGGQIDDSGGPWGMEVKRVSFFKYVGPASVR